MKYIKIAVVIMLIAGCSSDPIASGDRKAMVELDQDKKSAESLERVFDSKGVVTFKNNDENLKKSFKIYNKDGSTFAAISLGEDKLIIADQSYRLSDYEKSRTHFSNKYGFSPRSFYPQTGFILQFEYKTIQENRIEVFIDKEHSITRYIDNDVNMFEVETWREHMMGAIINFNRNKNLVREQPLTTSKSIDITGYDNLTFSITQIKNDWVKVECVDFCEFYCPESTKIQGWVKWRSGREILIRFVYAC